VRIVSLCPSLTELVFALERGPELVGITRYCVHPAELVRGIEKVGGTKNPDVERIRELAPDVVLMNREENRAEDAETLRAAGLTVHDSMPRTVEETAAMVRSIGAALDRGRLGEAIAADIEGRAARARAAAEGREPVRFAYLIWRKPWMSVNRDTFAHALLELAGGKNVFGDRPVRYPEVTAEALADAEPDLPVRGRARRRAGARDRAPARALRPGRRRVPLLARLAHARRHRLRRGPDPGRPEPRSARVRPRSGGAAGPALAATAREGTMRP